MPDPTPRHPRTRRHRLAVVVPAAAILALGLSVRSVALEGTASSESPQGRRTLEIPIDSPLARNEHPRLLFTKAQLPAIKARLAESPLREDFRLLKRTLDEGLKQGSDRARNAIVALGVMYQLTGDAKYGEACKQAVLQRGSFGTYAALGLYGYDLVYDLMTPDQRRSCEEKSVAFMRENFWRHRARLIHAVGVYGCEVDHALVAGQLAELYPWLKQHMRELNRWAQYRGGDGNSCR